jgi:hypothetical protein
MTWEVLRDTGTIHTYHMEDNPEYAYIIFTRYCIFAYAHYCKHYVVIDSVIQCTLALSKAYNCGISKASCCFHAA